MNSVGLKKRGRASNSDDSDDDDMGMRTTKKVMWSEEEIIQLIKMIEQYVNHPIYSGRIKWTSISKRIMNSDELRAVFAEKHIDPKKLHDCAKRIAKPRGLSPSQLTVTLYHNSEEWR